MTVTIYHNPRCSKSRKTLQLLTDAGISPDIVEYLKEPPSAATIVDLAGKLGVSVSDLLRTGEADYKDARDLPSLDDEVALAEWIEAHPKVLQRPIVIDTDSGVAVIGRPPDNVDEIISG